jgi:hypothetical protein
MEGAQRMKRVKLVIEFDELACILEEVVHS